MAEDALDKPAHVRAVDLLLKELNAEELAGNMNALSGGSLRGSDALNMARLVSLAALRHRGRSMIVGGLGAQWDHGTLTLFIGKEVVSEEIE